MINYILFDVDNSLYPASCGIGKEMIRRMNLFTAEFLGVSVQKAAQMRQEKKSKLYDSTLDWLQKKYSFSDTESFFRFIHPQDLENYFPKNNDLIDMLEKISIPFSVLTNSSVEHASNVTEYLGIKDLFENIYDLKFNNYRGKPNRSAYENVLKAIDRKAENVLFIDDVPSYLDAFTEIGGNVLLVDENSDYKESALPSISRITELLSYLETIDHV